MTSLAVLKVGEEGGVFRFSFVGQCNVGVGLNSRLDPPRRAARQLWHGLLDVRTGHFFLP
jgi:hypothetical protein